MRKNYSTATAVIRSAIYGSHMNAAQVAKRMNMSPRVFYLRMADPDSLKVYELRKLSEIVRFTPEQLQVLVKGE